MKKILIVMLMMLAFIASCGKGGVKKVSEDSKTATEAFAVAEEIRNAYIKRDIQGIGKNTTRDGFRIISSAMKSFDSVDLTFNPVWVEIDGDIVNLNISWEGTWQKAGKTFEERGMAIFVLRGRPLKVDNILRSNPLRYPE
jgi:stage V sporulation protein SpoVS